MISNLNLLNPKAIPKEFDLNGISSLITKIKLNNSDPLLEITLCYLVDDSYSLFILISFIGVEKINIDGWDYDNEIKNYNIQSDRNIINIVLENGYINFKYEWANIESCKKILNGSY